MTTTTVATPARLDARRRDSPWRRAVLAGLAGLRGGALEIEEDGIRHLLGEPGGLLARVTVRDPRFWRRVALGGSLGAGESYADGDWEVDDLTAAVRLLARNHAALRGLDGGLSLLRRPLDLGFALLRRNSRAGARRNIADHYDLGNDFFALMLDPTMTYSSGVWDRPGCTLEEAQVRKLDLLCRRLRLRPEDHLLEIGTGWGSLAIHAASRYGCRVTTTTLSRAQWELASERVRAAGLQDRVTLLREDYRDLRGRYDKIVSIEMFEAVGLPYYDDFFRACDRLLRPDGSMLLQTITINEQAFPAYHRSSDWIQKYIFPGAELASVSEILRSLARATSLGIYHAQDIGTHYARTLAEWRKPGEDWQLVRRNQFTDVSGPGGISGNANPETDPIWSIGWDEKSVLLLCLDRGTWHTYRLPKGSHSYDGAHGWNTEWPRIRDIGEEEFLMTMHGLFWGFPKNFSSEHSAGIHARSAYLKVIGDFCRWNDRVVFGCDDTAKNEFLNKRKAKGEIAAPQSQSV